MFLISVCSEPEHKLISVCSEPEHKLDDEIGANKSLAETSFALAMRLARGTVSVVDANGVSWSRIWCGNCLPPTMSEAQFSRLTLCCVFFFSVLEAVLCALRACLMYSAGSV